MKWNEFLETLDTAGGKIFLLLALLLWFVAIAVFMHLEGRDPGQTGLTLESNFCTSLFTTLLLKLKDKD